jgi:hypothetical protein
MVDRKVVPFDEFYYQLKLMYLFQKHPVYKIRKITKIQIKTVPTRNKRKNYVMNYLYIFICGFYSCRGNEMAS